MVYCIIPCSAISVEENGLMDLVIVCELIKIFHSKCTNKIICIYVCIVYVPIVYVRICMYVCAYSCMRMLEPKQTWIFSVRTFIR